MKLQFKIINLEKQTSWLSEIREYEDPQKGWNEIESIFNKYPSYALNFKDDKNNRIILPYEILKQSIVEIYEVIDKPIKRKYGKKEKINNEERIERTDSENESTKSESL